MHFPVQRKIGSARSINLFLIPVVMIICAFAIVGEGGILHGYSAKIRLKSVSQSVSDVEKRNETLRRQIKLVQENPRIAKQLIAENMLWVPPSTSVYRFENIETQASSEMPNKHGWMSIIRWVSDELGSTQ